MKKIFILILLILSTVIAEGAPPSRIFSYVSGSTISPDEVTQNEDAIFNYLSRGVDTFAGGITTDNITDGTITNADISGSAGITFGKLAGSIPDSKLDQITTASKVSGAALTGLASIPSGAGVIPAANLTSVAQKGANSDITSITGLTTALTTAQGGTGATAAANAANGVVVPTGAVNAANGAVILTSATKYPAIDGSLITNLNTIPAYLADNAAIISSSTAETFVTGGSYTKVKEIAFYGSGTISVAFDLKADANTAYGRIYKNGVAAGTERSTASTSYVTQATESFSGIVNGDLIQIYTYNNEGSSRAYVQNFKIYGSLSTKNTE